MKHAAEILRGDDYVIYSSKSTRPTGTYHWAEPKNGKPPTLTKITRTHHKLLTRYFDGDELWISHTEIIWKHGWHHIKGARKIARKRKHA